MNYRLLSRLLGVISLLIGGMMVFSLIWAFPALGRRSFRGVALHDNLQFETRGFVGMLGSVIICVVVGLVMMWWGRSARGRLYRKEAMAVVGLSWVLATVLGALPFWLCGVYRSPSLRLHDPGQPVQIYNFQAWIYQHWIVKDRLTTDQYEVLDALLSAGTPGLTADELQQQTGHDRPLDTLAELARRPGWSDVLLLPTNGGADNAQSSDQTNSRDPQESSAGKARVRWVRMGIADGLFESQSGFSTTGATVITDLEDPAVIPHCVLFWRSSTHFLGGLGIIVLFVTILGQGSAGKALMRAEMPGPTKEGVTARMQHTAWLFAFIYCGLNLLLAIILMFLDLTAFDAICHAFGTMGTGGFSTYNRSLGHFDSPAIEYVVTLFMILAGSNFTLLSFLLLHPGKLLQDVEWRTYFCIILLVTALVLMFGLSHGDFPGDNFTQRCSSGLRYGLFQVVSIITTTGFGTHDFDRWNSFGRGVLFLLMFVGGCAGSTGGGMKVIRHVLFIKILGLEVERAYHPSVVRPLRLGGRPVDDPDLRHNILVYIGIIVIIFVGSWMFVVTTEPDVTWGSDGEHKLIDSASAVAATLNNIGPGLGTVGSTQNYGQFSAINKFLFVWLMMIGRLEIFSILVLFLPGFWRAR